ncbi:MAG TPA: hypothetical protein VGZ90_01885 [Puia sp.]|nr:hypothetical protein [Puia sp.]
MATVNPYLIFNGNCESVSSPSKSDADKIFNSLSAGGNITMPIADTFWGIYFGKLLDKFGIIWMVSDDSPRV